MKIEYSFEIKNKLKNLPDKPGCYLMRDINGRIIYIGKAKSLKKRLQSYFRENGRNNKSPKIKNLIQSISGFDIIVLKTEKEAILKEGKLIKEYKPYYNTLWKDDKNFQYIRINIFTKNATVNLSRIKYKDNALYFGPYIKSRVAKLAVKYIEKFFGFKIISNNNNQSIESASIIDLRKKFNIPELNNLNDFEKEKYINEVSKFLHGQRVDLIKKLSIEMQKLSLSKHYEKAGEIRDLIFHLKNESKVKVNLIKDTGFIKKEVQMGLNELQKELSLLSKPIRIECFDVSNISGMYSVGSMVVAINGVPKPIKYKRFRIKSVEGINDPKSIAEIVNRHYIKVLKNPSKLPDLIIIDGGITQLNAAIKKLNYLGLEDIPIVGLAKKREEIILNKFKSIILSSDSIALKIITNLRDEAHRFAINYHRNIRNREIMRSELDLIVNIGEHRKKLLLSYFGSIMTIKKASVKDLMKVKGIGVKTANIIYSSFRK